ncbi:hypothetical protein [Pseudorhodoplanes sinuspersici]|uniref:hypothetical protein n=1 Tax=Pseudorhodoplanes sinuspersici TaxID=1235591 RepID=UPI0012FD4C0E|nr:hypothetical protein [Pseudorhodoplanes sinuspersici]
MAGPFHGMLLAAQIFDLCGACWRVEKIGVCGDARIRRFFVCCPRQLIESLDERD